MSEQLRKSIHYLCVAFGDAVCSTRCFKQHTGYQSRKEAVRHVDDQLRAIRKAEKLPLVYERRRAS